MAWGIFQICVGVVVIVFGLNADKFSAAFIRQPRPDEKPEKPASKWLGRTIWVAVGATFILSGLQDLRHR
jgi:hypothetical protein